MTREKQTGIEKMTEMVGNRGQRQERLYMTIMAARKDKGRCRQTETDTDLH